MCTVVIPTVHTAEEVGSAKVGDLPEVPQLARESLALEPRLISKSAGFLHPEAGLLTKPGKINYEIKISHINKNHFNLLKDLER